METVSISIFNASRVVASVPQLGAHFVVTNDVTVKSYDVIYLIWVHLTVTNRKYICDIYRYIQIYRKKRKTIYSAFFDALVLSFIKTYTIAYELMEKMTTIAAFLHPLEYSPRLSVAR